MTQKYEPLSEQELGEIEKEAKGDTGWDRWWTLDYMRLIATIKELQGQVRGLETAIAGVWEQYEEGGTYCVFCDVLGKYEMGKPPTHHSDCIVRTITKEG